jgi:hypothetical protein
MWGWALAASTGSSARLEVLPTIESCSWCDPKADLHNELTVPLVIALTELRTTTKDRGTLVVRGDQAPMGKLFNKYPVTTLIVIWATLIMAMWLAPSDPRL